ncbi:hypothetical protein VCHENC02_1382A, partial [Vibrio harveyi]
MQFTFK